MANVKRPFMRTGSLFKRKRETPYQSWEDEDSLLDDGKDSSDRTTELRRLEFRDESPQTEEQDCVFGSSGSNVTEAMDGELHLGDCFYLGCYDMTGLGIRGRGCIDFPAGHIWERTQEDWQKKRRSSLPSRLESSYKPRYVRLVAAMDELKVYDCHTSKLLLEFDYKNISFVGTHPKYTRLFAFIAEAKGKRVPFCHGFKCQDIESAENTANTLSSVFDRKSKELLAARLQQKIQVDISTAVVN